VAAPGHTLSYSRPDKGAGASASGNSASFGLGGGIFAYSCPVTIKDSTVTNNTAYQGGGLYASYSDVTIDQSTLNDLAGGGIWNDFSTVHLEKTVVDGVLYEDQNYP
jgi:predicted outer membrane repeat protein